MNPQDYPIPEGLRRPWDEMYSLEELLIAVQVRAEEEA